MPPDQQDGSGGLRRARALPAPWLPALLLLKRSSFRSSVWGRRYCSCSLGRLGRGVRAFRADHEPQEARPSPGARAAWPRLGPPTAPLVGQAGREPAPSPAALPGLPALPRVLFLSLFCCSAPSACVSGSHSLEGRSLGGGCPPRVSGVLRGLRFMPKGVLRCFPSLPSARRGGDTRLGPLRVSAQVQEDPCPFPSSNNTPRTTPQPEPPQP